jgi:hypothetical protein
MSNRKIESESNLLPRPSGEIERCHLVGTGTAVNSPNFTMQTSFGNLMFTVATDDNTKYEFDGFCATDNFCCIAAGQILKMFVSARIDLLDGA